MATGIIIPLMYPLIIMFIVFWVLGYFLASFQMVIDLIWSAIND